MPNNPIFVPSYTAAKPSYQPVVQPTPPATLPEQTESLIYVQKYREQNSEIDLQRFHDETLQTYGEQCLLRLLWRAEDFTAGLVGRCIVCQDSETPTTPNITTQQRVAKVYGQSGNTYCPN